jgi:high-affinity nickel-transport protein
MTGSIGRKCGLFGQSARSSRARVVVGLYLILLAGSAGTWLWAFALFSDSRALIGTAVLAYVLGLRHAVDADHIAAIDNVIRKLVQQGLKPISVGLYFSLGHSTVVALACFGIALASVSLRENFAAAREIGKLMGTGISAGFLFAIALTNIVTLTAVWRDFRRARAGAAVEATALLPVGLMGRLLKRLVAIVSHPWQMLPLGFLLGLGFDTASEVGVLGISAGQASHAAQFWAIMVFPILFAAGMTMIDTTDGLLMVGAYGWALKQPARKLTYNFIITAFSVLVAVVIGALELLELVGDRFTLTGGFWNWVGNASHHSGAIGCGIVAALIASWTISYFLTRHGSRLATRL